MTAQATDNPILRQRLNYMINQLAEIQAANKSVHACRLKWQKHLCRHRQLKIQIGGLPWTGYEFNGNFEPTYTLNKLMLGLYQTWLTTQKVRIELPIRLYIESLLGEAHYCRPALRPHHLVRTLGTEGLTKYDFWQIHDTVGWKNFPASNAPVLVASTANDILSHLKPVSGNGPDFCDRRACPTPRRDPDSILQDHFQGYEAHPGRLAGSLFEVRLLAKNSKSYFDQTIFKSCIEKNTESNIK